MKVGNTVLVWIILYFTVTMYKKGGGGEGILLPIHHRVKKMGAKLFWQAYLNAPDRTGTHLRSSFTCHLCCPLSLHLGR